jgi:hypothetical protein
MQNNQKKFDLLRLLHLPLDQYAITASGPLGIRNLREIGDIDIIVSVKLWDSLASIYGIDEQNSIKKIMISPLISAFGEKSFPGPKDEKAPSIVQRLLDAEIIEGLPFESLKHVLYYKHLMKRPKDLKDIELIKNWLKTQ